MGWERGSASRMLFKGHSKRRLSIRGHLYFWDQCSYERTRIECKRGVGGSGVISHSLTFDYARVWIRYHCHASESSMSFRPHQTFVFSCSSRPPSTRTPGLHTARLPAVVPSTSAPRYTSCCRRDSNGGLEGVTLDPRPSSSVTFTPALGALDLQIPRSPRGGLVRRVAQLRPGSRRRRARGVVGGRGRRGATIIH